jgi:hypothetical protein
MLSNQRESGQVQVEPHYRWLQTYNQTKSTAALGIPLCLQRSLDSWVQVKLAWYPFQRISTTIFEADVGASDKERMDDVRAVFAARDAVGLCPM